MKTCSAAPLWRVTQGSPGETLALSQKSHKYVTGIKEEREVSVQIKHHKNRQRSCGKVTLPMGRGYTIKCFPKVLRQAFVLFYFVFIRKSKVPIFSGIRCLLKFS